MKKIILSVTSIATTVGAFAQEKDSITTISPKPNLDNVIMTSVNQINYLDKIMPLLVICLFVFFCIGLTKFILEYRLKNKIIDKGISEQLATSILEKSATNKKDDAMKWTLLLLGTGIGAIISYYTMPLNIHSLAIMAISIAASYLGYFFYLKKQDK